MRWKHQKLKQKTFSTITSIMTLNKSCFENEHKNERLQKWRAMHCNYCCSYLLMQWSNGYVMQCCYAICFFNSCAMAIKTKRYRCVEMRSSDAAWAQQVMSDIHLYQISDRIRTRFCCMTTVQCNLVRIAWHNLTQHEKTFLHKVQAWFLSMPYQRDIVKQIVLHCWRHYCFYAMFESRVTIIDIVI